MDVLTIEKLEKSFGSQKVLKGINLHVTEHTIYGFIGQNGAGKTTTMKMILGLLPIDQGNIYVCGERVCFGETKTNAYVGYLSDVPEYYGFMNAREYMQLCADISGLSKQKAVIRIKELLTMVGLEADPKKRIQGYSRGMKQRLGIAQALLNEPKLLICDEPTSALDPIGRKEILDILQQVKQQTTVMLSTHILSDVERICDHIAILKDGVIALHGGLADLKQQYGKNKITVTFQTQQAMQTMANLWKNHSFEAEEHTLTIETLEPKELEREVLQSCLNENCMPISFAWQQPSLEHLFMEVVQ